MWPFVAADYAASSPPITNAYAAGNFVIAPLPGAVKVTANYKAQFIKFYAVDPNTGEKLERYFIKDVWGNEYIMHASGATDQNQVRAAFEAAILPERWTKEIRYPDKDVVLEPAEGTDGSHHYLVLRDSADNTYHQISWSGRGTVTEQIEGMPIWGDRATMCSLTTMAGATSCTGLGAMMS